MIIVLIYSSFCLLVYENIYMYYGYSDNFKLTVVFINSFITPYKMIIAFL